MTRCECTRKAVSALSQAVTVHRPPVGAYNDRGRWEDQEPEKLTVLAVVQPATSGDLMRLPEGRRESEAIKLFSLSELRTASAPDKTQPDEIEFNGKRWQVEAVDDWDEVGGYYKAIALKIGQ